MRGPSQPQRPGRPSPMRPPLVQPHIGCDGLLMTTTDPVDVDNMEVPTWMRLVADSDLTERMLEKARVRRDRLEDARQSAHPRAHVYIDGMREVTAAARLKWAPGTDLNWWTTATRNAALQAYVSAHEFSEVDPEAKAAAQQMRVWFETR